MILRAPDQLINEIVPPAVCHRVAALATGASHDSTCSAANSAKHPSSRARGAWCAIFDRATRLHHEHFLVLDDRAQPVPQSRAWSAAHQRPPQRRAPPALPSRLRRRAPTSPRREAAAVRAWRARERRKGAAAGRGSAPSRPPRCQAVLGARARPHRAGTPRAAPTARRRYACRQRRG